ncbi:hypothetical protein IAQ61_004959 [Plenodomus lingam]|uniref:uncharacterized protein n=1 Tax=Leptosphaeria maculans TaxID=5022 RepID=UPI00332CA1B0|nr:hypothetical protein IAQ61_004959 [Plenodomus lingam]
MPPKSDSRQDTARTGSQGRQSIFKSERMLKRSGSYTRVGLDSEHNPIEMTAPQFVFEIEADDEVKIKTDLERPAMSQLRSRWRSLKHRSTQKSWQRDGVM